MYIRNTLRGLTQNEIKQLFQSAGFIDAMNNPVNPMGIYVLAQSRGISGLEIESALGWANGTVLQWTTTQNLPPLNGAVIQTPPTTIMPPTPAPAPVPVPSPREIEVTYPGQQKEIDLYERITNALWQTGESVADLRLRYFKDNGVDPRFFNLVYEKYFHLSAPPMDPGLYVVAAPPPSTAYYSPPGPILSRKDAYLDSIVQKGFQDDIRMLYFDALNRSYTGDELDLWLNLGAGYMWRWAINEGLTPLPGRSYATTTSSARQPPTPRPGPTMLPPESVNTPLPPVQIMPPAPQPNFSPLPPSSGGGGGGGGGNSYATQPPAPVFLPAGGSTSVNVSTAGNNVAPPALNTKLILSAIAALLLLQN